MSRQHRPGCTRQAGTRTRQTNLHYQTIFEEITRKNAGLTLTTVTILALVKAEVAVWNPGTPDDHLVPIRQGYSRWLHKFGWTPGKVGYWTAPGTVGKAAAPPVPEPAKVEPPKPEPVTEYIFCLDASGSMDGFRLVEPTRKAFNAQIDAIRASQVGKVFVTLYSFGSRISTLRERQAIEDVKPLEYFTAQEGSTRMFDCIEHAIRKSEASPTAAYVLTVLTDGGNNSGSNGVLAARMISETLGTGRWTHAIMIPKGDPTGFRGIFKIIPAGNIVEWDTTEAGAAKVGEQAIQAAKTYMTSRATGVTRSTNYFQPNLSAVTEADLAKCTDLSGAFKRYQAVKETTCKDIAEERTKKPFVLGSAYYQLTKREKIQGHKQLLLWHRPTGRVFGGVEARKLIGLQLGVDAKVEPGNHGDLEIYCKSTSINRIVPRGAAMLHDANQVVPDQATWDHEGAKAAAEAKKAAQAVH